MPELIAVSLRRLLLTFPHPATLDDDVVLVLPPPRFGSVEVGVAAPACRHLHVGQRPVGWRRPPLPIVHNPRHNPVHSRYACCAARGSSSVHRVSGWPPVCELVPVAGRYAPFARSWVLCSGLDRKLGYVLIITNEPLA